MSTLAQRITELWSSSTPSVKVELVVLAVGIATLVVTAIAAIPGFLNYFLDTSTARKPARLFVRPFGTEASDLVVVVPFAEGTGYGIPFVIDIVNDGEKSAKNVSVELELSDDLYLHGIGRTPDKISKARKLELAADLSQNKNIARVYWGLPDIAPKSRARLSDFVYVKTPTVGDSTTKATSRDGVPVEVSWRALWSYWVRITVTADDLAPVLLKASIAFLKGRGTTIEEDQLETLLDPDRQPRVTEWTLVGFETFTERTDLGLPLMEGDINSLALARLMVP